MASRPVLIPCCLPKDEPRGSSASSAPCPPSYACGFYFGCKQRRQPHDSPPPHSSTHPSNDSCSHSTFLLTSLALCQTCSVFLWRKSPSWLNEWRAGRSPWITSKYPRVSVKWTKTQFHRIPPPPRPDALPLFSYSYMHMYRFTAIYSPMQPPLLFDSNLFMKTHGLVHFRE